MTIEDRNCGAYHEKIDHLVETTNNVQSTLKEIMEKLHGMDIRHEKRFGNIYKGIATGAIGFLISIFMFTYKAVWEVIK